MPNLFFGANFLDFYLFHFCIFAIAANKMAATEQRIHPVGRSLPPDDASSGRIPICIRLGRRNQYAIEHLVVPCQLPGNFAH